MPSSQKDIVEKAKIPKSLNLRNKGLNKLKKKFIVKSVEVLDISENELSSLKNITKIDSLKELYVSSNSINEVADSISKLSCLKILDLSGNPIDQLPDSIEKCSELTTLKLSDCNFSLIPDVMSQLKNLVHLDLSGNEGLRNGKDNEFDPLSELELETLKLSNCKLKSLPTVINSLKTLKELDISHNALSKLSSGIQKLSNLSYINLSANKFDSIPHILAKIKTLKKISIAENPIEDLHEYFPEFNSLEELDITWKNLRIQEYLIFKDDISQLAEYISTLYQKKDEFNVDVDDHPKFSALCRFCTALENNSNSITMRNFYKLFGFRFIESNDVPFFKRVFTIFDKHSVEFDDYIQLIEKLQNISYEEKAKYLMLIFGAKHDITHEDFTKTITEYMYSFNLYIFAAKLYRSKLISDTKLDEDLQFEFQQDLESMKEHILEDSQQQSAKYDKAFYKLANSSKVIEMNNLVEFLKENEEGIFQNILRNVTVGISEGIKNIPQLLLLKIDNHMSDGRFDKANSLIERFISKYGETSHILLKKAEYALKTDKYKDVIKSCKKILKLGFEADQPQCWRIYGNAYEKEEKYDKAIEAYEKSLSFEPNLLDTLISKGWLEFKREKFQQAYDSSIKALEIEYDNPEAVALKYLSSRSLKMPRKEIESTGYLAKKLNPDNETISNLVKVPYSKKETKESIEKKLKELNREEKEYEQLEKAFQEKRKSMTKKQ